MKKKYHWGAREANAYQHGLWVGAMRVLGVSEHDAMMFAVAHELDHSAVSPPDPPLYGPESNKDMHNNFVSLRLAEKAMNEINSMSTKGSYTGGRAGVPNFRHDPLYELEQLALKAMNPNTCGSNCLAVQY